MIDDMLPNVTVEFIAGVYIIAGSCLVIAIVNPWTLVSLLLIVPAILLILPPVVKCCVETRRMEIGTKSPVITLLTICASGINGVISIRGFKY
jgi:hypothetical protein